MDDWLKWWELASYIVTVIGLPLAIVIFMLEQRKARLNEEGEIQQLLANNYTDFLKLVLNHPDLRLLVADPVEPRSDEDRERIYAIYSILVSLFERAFMLTYSDDMSPQQKRYWQTWRDFMNEWCARKDFRDLLPRMLVGEDPDFVTYLSALAKETEARQMHAKQAS